MERSIAMKAPCRSQRQYNRSVKRRTKVTAELAYAERETLIRCDTDLGIDAVAGAEEDRMERTGS